MDKTPKTPKTPKTYVIGKLGKSVSFDKNKWGAIGGDIDAPSLFLALATHNPGDTFIIIGRSDLAKYKKKEKLPANLIDVYEIYSEKFLNGEPVTGKNLKEDYIVQALEGIDVHAGIIVGGPTGTTNLTKRCHKRGPLEKENKIEWAKTLGMHTNYSAPMYEYLNESMITWVQIVHDPRYTKVGRDMINHPKIALSQYDTEFVSRTVSNFEDQRELIDAKVKVIYAQQEKALIINRPVKLAKKTDKFVIVLNEGNNGAKSRYPELKKYVLDHIQDVDIYGKWTHEDSLTDSRL